MSQPARCVSETDSASRTSGPLSDLGEVRQRLLVGQLSPTLQRAARAIFERPHEFAFLPLTAFADQVGIPGTTFVRLARAAGLAGYKDLKNAFRRSLRGALK